MGAYWRITLTGVRYLDVKSAPDAVRCTYNTFNGWYVQGSWVLTGENKGYNSQTAAFTPPKPDKPFALDGSGGGAVKMR